MLRYIKWVLRSASRFRHRVVLLVDSKVTLGLAAKGRSSSMTVNALIRKAAALCFAGGLILHHVFIPTKYNPADWPSRGEAKTWPAELRRRSYRPAQRPRCPACGVLPEDHPLHLPNPQRGHLASFRTCCAGHVASYALDFAANRWVRYYKLYSWHMKMLDEASAHPAVSDSGFFLLGVNDDRTAARLEKDYAGEA